MPYSIPSKLLLLLLSAHAAYAAHFYASPDGKPEVSGLDRASPAAAAAILPNLKAGDTLWLASGVYAIPYDSTAKNTLTLAAKGTAGAPIAVIADGKGRAVFDFSYPPQAWTQDGFGFHLTGDYWRLQGVSVTRAGYQGVYVTGSHNTLVNCAFYENRNSGIEINKGGAYTTLIDCDAYRNYDPKKLGSMADGFAPKQTQGPGNRLVRCRAWENSDDGFDAFDSPDSVVFEGCWAFRNGVDIWKYGGFAGNGNGFKLGGNFQRANHRAANCIAFGHPGKGFDQNNNRGGLAIVHSIGYLNGRNFGLINALDAGQKHVLKNNVSLEGNAEIENAEEANNSWNAGFGAAAADFQSLDTALAARARNADGSLPETPLFRLKSGSKLIDAGAGTGLVFMGAAPDIGAFEFRSGVTGLSAPGRAKAGGSARARIRTGRAGRVTVPGPSSRVYSILGEAEPGDGPAGY